MIFEGKMVHKRPFRGEDSYEVSCKHPRQVEHANQLNPILPSNYVPGEPHTSSGEDEDSFGKSLDGGRITSDSARELLSETEKGYGTSASGDISRFSWTDVSFVDEDAKLKAAAHMSFFSEYFEPDHRVRLLVQSDDIYLNLMDCPTRRLVPVGPDHQACVPEWGQQNSKYSSDSSVEFVAHNVFLQSSGLGVGSDDDNWERLLGTCILPMPDLELPAYNCSSVFGLGSNCSCLERGSVRCVRQHVAEAREKLIDSLGQEIFEELGFSDMGEEVAKTWSEEDEKSFHDVVCSNPASLDKNFWEHLLINFPSRTKKDLVSYYFNVFMLRKRAGQNRFDPLNIDSDNDQWQWSELGSEEEDEDSGVEFQMENSAPVYDQGDYGEDHPKDLKNEDGIVACEDDSEVLRRRDAPGMDTMKDVDDISRTQIEFSHGDYSFYSNFEFSYKIPGNREGYDIYDNQFTPYEYEHQRVDSCVPVDLGAGARKSSGE